MTTPPPAVTAEEAKDAASILVSWCPADRQSPFDVVMRYIEQTSRATCLAAPKGWKLVPVEPTDEMLGASVCKANGFKSDHRKVYRAMLDGAPAAEVADERANKGDRFISITVGGSTHTRTANEWLALARADLRIGAALAGEPAVAAADEGREASLREIDLALAAMADLKPLVEYGQPGTYDTVQARRKTALLRAERSLLYLRRELAAKDGVKGPEHG